MPSSNGPPPSADVVPLQGENRVIAKLGLELLSKGPHKVGLRALLDASGLSGKTIDKIAAVMDPADAGSVWQTLTRRPMPSAERVSGFLPTASCSVRRRFCSGVGCAR
mgnify:CR=1 FL=1